MSTAVQTSPLNATVVHWEALHASLAVLRVRPDSGVVPAFEAGQWTMLGLPDPDPAAKTKIIKRAYSIASCSAVRDSIEFFIARVDEGRLTSKLFGLGGVGGRVWMDPKVFGDFTLAHIPRGKDLLLLSTGTGLAPFVSMLRQYRYDPPWRRVCIINGVRFSQDLGYVEELEAEQRRNGAFKFITVVSREPVGSAYTGVRGRVQAVLEAADFEAQAGMRLDPATMHVFMCGNPEMIKQTQPWLEGKGFTLHTKKQPGNIHFERYW